MDKIIMDVINFLKERDFYSACDEVCKYESSKTFNRGLGIDWKEDYKNKNYENDISIFK